ncbi:hypothetical protein L915_02661, partial [Phytophthora nicotianae]
DVESRLNGGSLPPLATKRQNTVSGAPDASLSSDCEHGDISTSPGETSRATGTRTRGGDPLISIWPGRSMPWLRSGRSFAHPLVPESETIQVRPLSELELNTLPEADQTDGTASSESTISEAWNASSLAAPSPALGRFRVRDTFTGSRLHAPIRGSSSQSSNEENNEYAGFEGYDPAAVTIICTPSKSVLKAPLVLPWPQLLALLVLISLGTHLIIPLETSGSRRNGHWK